jgi:hypothetical protein
MSITGRIRSTVRSGIFAVLALALAAADVSAAERRAGSVIAVDAAGRGLTLDEFGVAGVRRTVQMNIAPDAEVVISEREEPVTNFYRPFRDTVISLAEVRPGDFVVLEIGDRPGIADRVIVTRNAGS